MAGNVNEAVPRQNAQRTPDVIVAYTGIEFDLLVIDQCKIGIAVAPCSQQEVDLKRIKLRTLPEGEIPKSSQAAVTVQSLCGKHCPRLAAIEIAYPKCTASLRRTINESHLGKYI
jgi:hypothetical protein